MASFRAARVGLAVAMGVLMVAGLAPGSVAAVAAAPAPSAPAVAGAPAVADQVPFVAAGSAAAAPVATTGLSSTPVPATTGRADATAPTLSTAEEAASMVGCTMPVAGGEGPVCPARGTAPAMPSFLGARPATSGPAVQPAASSGDWTQFHNGPTHSGYNAAESTISKANVTSLRAAWTGTTGDSIFSSSPAIANGVVYVGSLDGKLYAYAVGCAGGGASCTPLWTGATGGHIDSSPAVANGVVYVGSYDDKLYAFDAAGVTNCSGSGTKTCTPLWTATTGSPVYSSPTVANGVVYIGSDEGKLYAFDADGATNCSGSGTKTCTPLWTATTAGGIFHSAPAVANGVVYIGSAEGNLYALDAAGITNCSGSGTRTCTPLWTATTGGVGGSGINASPAVANGVVYIGTEDNKLYAFDAAGVTNCSGSGTKTCAPLWTAATGWYVVSSPAVANGVVYVGSNDDKLYAFDAAGVTNCSGSGTKTCSPLWTASTGNSIDSSPAIANGVVYVGSNDEDLYAFDAAGVTNCSGSGTKTCAPLWTATTGNSIASSPAVANGVVYVGSDDGKLYAFSLYEKLSGTVTHGASGLANIDVYIVGTDGKTVYGQATTASDGTWSAEVPSGAYRICYHDATATYGNGYLGTSAFTYSWKSARVVTVTAANITGLNVALPLAVHITGTVTHGSSPVAGLDVFVYDKDNNQIGPFITDANGHYSAALAPGGYRVQFWDTSLTYPDGYWSSSGFTQDFKLASAITLSSADVTANANLPTGYKISGSLTNSSSVALSGIGVYVWATNGDMAGWARTNSSGAYTVVLAAGDYALSFDDSTHTYSYGFSSGAGFTPDPKAAHWFTISHSQTIAKVILPLWLSKPLAVTAIGKDASAKVSWTAPLHNGGAPITSYTVTSSTGGKQCVTATLSCTVSGLTNHHAYTFTVVAHTAYEASVASNPSNTVTPLSGATYHTVTPARVLDSRLNLGGSTFVARTKQTVTIANGTNGVPASAVAVTGNVTIVGQTTNGYVTVAPNLTSGVTPATSTLNFPLGDIRANGITVPLASGGKLDFMYWVPGSDYYTVSVIFDVTGYFSADASGSTYHTVTPARVLDSRLNLGGSTLVARTKQTVTIANGTSGVPASAVAVTGNVTIVGQTTNGYVTVAPNLTSGVTPATSTLNFPLGDVRANGITVPLASGGKLDFMYWVPGSDYYTVSVIFDVTGYFE